MGTFGKPTGRISPSLTERDCSPPCRGISTAEGQDCEVFRPWLPPCLPLDCHPSQALPCCSLPPPLLSSPPLCPHSLRLARSRPPTPCPLPGPTASQPLLPRLWCLQAPAQSKRQEQRSCCWWAQKGLSQEKEYGRSALRMNCAQASYSLVPKICTGLPHNLSLVGFLIVRYVNKGRGPLFLCVSLDLPINPDPPPFPFPANAGRITQSKSH